MNTCGTCKYKTLDEDGDTIKVYPDCYYEHGKGMLSKKTNTPIAVDADGNALPIKHFFLCGRIKEEHYMDDGEKLTEKAMVMDGSGYYAALCVEDDFGCVLWEAK